MKNKVSIILAIIVSTCFGCGFLNSDSALPPSKNMEEDIEEIVSAIYKNGQFTGAVLVSVKGEIVYKNAFGFANREDSILNTTQTKFRIASFTKPFTAMLILQLVEEDKLQLDGKLTDYLPEFPKEKGAGITIHQLLTHKAGITGEWRIPNLVDIEKEYYTRERLLNTIIERDLVFEPGKGREYSNFGFALLGMVIEKVSGKTYEELLQEKICKPAGMKNTLGDVNAQYIENRAIGYVHDYFNGIGVYPFIDMSFAFGAGHLLSTVEDLYLFDKALYSDNLLNEKSKELFFNKYGWFYDRIPYGKGYKKIRSNNLDGSVNGFQSHTQRIENDTVFISILRNIKESVYENQIVIKWPNWMVSRILAVIYGEEYDMPKKSGAFEIFTKLIHTGYDEAKEMHLKIVNAQTDKYYLDDKEFEFFEKELIRKGMAGQAGVYKNIYNKSIQ